MLCNLFIPKLIITCLSDDVMIGVSSSFLVERERERERPVIFAAFEREHSSLSRTSLCFTLACDCETSIFNSTISSWVGCRVLRTTMTQMFQSSALGCTT